MLSSVSIYKNVLDKCSYEDYFKKLKAHGNVKKNRIFILFHIKIIFRIIIELII